MEVWTKFEQSRSEGRACVEDGWRRRAIVIRLYDRPEMVRMIETLWMRRTALPWVHARSIKELRKVRGHTMPHTGERLGRWRHGEFVGRTRGSTSSCSRGP